MERENLRILEKNIEILGKMEKPTVGPQGASLPWR